MNLFHLAGPAPGWHLEHIDVKDEIMDKTFRFPCDRWLSKNDDDGQIMRELACANNDCLDLSEKTSKLCYITQAHCLVCLVQMDLQLWSLSTEYEISVTTGETETKENVWIVLEGKKARSKEFVMENSSKKKRFLQ